MLKQLPRGMLDFIRNNSNEYHSWRLDFICSIRIGDQLVYRLSLISDAVKFRIISYNVGISDTKMQHLKRNRRTNFFVAALRPFPPFVGRLVIQKIEMGAKSN